MSDALTWRSVEHKQTTRMEFYACLLANAPEGRVYTYHVIAGARAMQVKQRASSVDGMTVGSWRGQ